MKKLKKEIYLKDVEKVLRYKIYKKEEYEKIPIKKIIKAVKNNWKENNLNSYCEYIKTILKLLKKYNYSFYKKN